MFRALNMEMNQMSTTLLMSAVHKNMDNLSYFFNLNIFMFSLFQHMSLQTNKILKEKIFTVAYLQTSLIFMLLGWFSRLSKIVWGVK